jgi:hypothetical protein
MATTDLSCLFWKPDRFPQHNMIPIAGCDSGGLFCFAGAVDVFGGVGGDVDAFEKLAAWDEAGAVDHQEAFTPRMCCLALSILRLPLPLAVFHGCQWLDFMDRLIDRLSTVDSRSLAVIGLEMSAKLT